MSIPRLPDFRYGTRGYNYRVVRHQDEDEPGGFVYAIHEVHYANGEIISITSEPVPVLGQDLQGILEAMNEARRRPVIDYTTGREL
jgi:hypothetical protein